MGEGPDEMEALLGELNGHLVLYSTKFLEGEDVVNNFLFNADRCVLFFFCGHRTMVD